MCKFNIHWGHRPWYRSKTSVALFSSCRYCWNWNIFYQSEEKTRGSPGKKGSRTMVISSYFIRCKNYQVGMNFSFAHHLHSMAALVWTLSLLVSASGTKQMFARCFVSPRSLITRSAATRFVVCASANPCWTISLTDSVSLLSLARPSLEGGKIAKLHTCKLAICKPLVWSQTPSLLVWMEAGLWHFVGPACFHAIFSWRQTLKRHAWWPQSKMSRRLHSPAVVPVSSSY